MYYLRKMTVALIVAIVIIGVGRGAELDRRDTTVSTDPVVDTIFLLE